MVKGTHENIINAFFRIAAKKDARLISLSEIATEAHVSRQAIYQKHFKTIDEIIDEVHQIIYQDIYSVLKDFESSQYNLNEFIAYKLIPRIYEHREWLRILYTSNIDSGWERFISEQYLPVINPHLNEISQRLKLSKDFIAGFIIKYYMSIISSWLVQDLPMPPDHFKKYFLQLVNTPISDFFDI